MTTVQYSQAKAFPASPSPRFGQLHRHVAALSKGIQQTWHGTDNLLSNLPGVNLPYNAMKMAAEVSASGSAFIPIGLLLGTSLTSLVNNIPKDPNRDAFAVATHYAYGQATNFINNPKNHLLRPGNIAIIAGGKIVEFSEGNSNKTKQAPNGNGGLTAKFEKAIMPNPKNDVSIIPTTSTGSLTNVTTLPNTEPLKLVGWGLQDIGRIVNGETYATPAIINAVAPVGEAPNPLSDGAGLLATVTGLLGTIEGVRNRLKNARQSSRSFTPQESMNIHVGGPRPPIPESRRPILNFCSFGLLALLENAGRVLTGGFPDTRPVISKAELIKEYRVPPESFDAPDAQKK
jgi:hypothetical protein